MKRMQGCQGKVTHTESESLFSCHVLVSNLLSGIFFILNLNRTESLVGKRILAVKLLQYTTTLNIRKITIYNVLKVFKKLFLKNKVLKKVIVGVMA